MAGYCSRVIVTLQADGGCRVDDDGRGVPVDPYPSGPHKGKSAVEVVLTVLHAGGKFGGGSYKVSGGLHGVGVSVVNALSERLVIEVDKDGSRYRQEYAKGGRPQGKLEKVGSTPPRGRTSGTTVVFWPDPSVFNSEGTEFHARTVLERLQTMAFLNKGLEIQLVDERPDKAAARHVRLQGRHRRLRQAPQRLQGVAVRQGGIVRCRRGRSGSRDRPPVEHGVLRGHPRLRQRHLDHRGRHARRGFQDRTHLGRQQVRPLPQPPEGEGGEPSRRGHPGGAHGDHLGAS